MVEPRLDFLEHGLVLPARYAALRSSGTLRLQRAALARACPVAPDRLAIFDAGKTIGQPLSGGTAIDILDRDIDEVLLAEAPFRLGARGLRLGQRNRDTGLLAGLDLLAVVVAAVRYRIEGLRAERLAPAQTC